MKISETRYNGLPEKQKVFFEADGNGAYVLSDENSEEFLDLAEGKGLATSLSASRKSEKEQKARADELARQVSELQAKLGETTATDKPVENPDALLLSKKQQQQLEAMQAELAASKAEREADKQAIQAREQTLKLQEKINAEFGKLPLIEAARQLLTSQAKSTFVIDSDGDIIAKDGNDLGVSAGTSLTMWASKIPETHAYAIDKTTHGGGARAGMGQKTQAPITPDGIKTAINTGAMSPSALAAQIAASGNGSVIRDAIANGGKLV